MSDSEAQEPPVPVTSGDVFKRRHGCPVACCDLAHAGPLPDQKRALHEGAVESRDSSEVTRLVVGAVSLERLGGEQTYAPRVVMHTAAASAKNVRLKPGQRRHPMGHQRIRGSVTATRGGGVGPPSATATT
jgi:hypothetical protein